MPTLANITVKKSDGTTDVVYTALAGSSGDNSPAIFRNDTVGSTLAERPTLLISSKSNGPKTGRRVNLEFSWPIAETDTAGRKTIVGRMTGTCSALIPQNQDVATINEQASQLSNLLGSAIVKASFTEGYAPRG